MDLFALCVVHTQQSNTEPSRPAPPSASPHDLLSTPRTLGTAPLPRRAAGGTRAARWTRRPNWRGRAGRGRSRRSGSAAARARRREGRRTARAGPPRHLVTRAAGLNGTAGRRGALQRRAATLRVCWCSALLPGAPRLSGHLSAAAVPPPSRRRERRSFREGLLKGPCRWKWRPSKRRGPPPSRWSLREGGRGRLRGKRQEQSGVAPPPRWHPLPLGGPPVPRLPLGCLSAASRLPLAFPCEGLRRRGR